MNLAQQIQDDDFLERMIRGGRIAGTNINFKSMPKEIGVGFFVFRGERLNQNSALRIQYNEKFERWEVYDPEEDNKIEPVCTNRSIQPCVHFCISIL